MGQEFSLPRLIGITDAAVIARLESLETELLRYIVRMLVCTEPASVGRLICCCKALEQLALEASEPGEELRMARRAVARRWLFDLRQFAGQQPAALTPLVTQSSRQLSCQPTCPEFDEPLDIDLSRWHRSTPENIRWLGDAPQPTADNSQRGTAVRRVLYASQALESVDLSVCYLTFLDAMQIADGLKASKSLTTLRAAGNFLGGCGRDGKFIPSPAGMEAFADALLVSQISSLVLAENRLGPEGIRALGPGLASTTLTSLDVSRNSMGAEGAAALAAGLAANSSLLKLDVRLNKLGSKGAEELAPGIAACASLTALDARFNGVGEGDEGDVALHEAAKERGAAFELRVLT